MKTIDKFVLVPFERYERLLKTPNDKEITTENQQQEIEKTNSLQKVGAGDTGDTTIKNKESSYLTNNNISKKKPEKHTPNPTGFHPSLITKKLNNKKKLKIKQLPPPPPGIPHKTKPHNSNWFSLF